MAHSNLLFSLALDPDMTGEMLLTEAKIWNQCHAAATEIPDSTHPNKPDKARRLRVGYVSPDFRDHAVGTLLAPLFDVHDRAEFKIFAYADVARPDKVTDWFEQRSDQWRNSFGWADTRLAQQIRDDRIDVLIDLAGRPGLVCRAQDLAQLLGERVVDLVGGGLLAEGRGGEGHDDGEGE